MKGIGDSELMALYAGGNEAAFEELFARYEGRAYGYFLRRVRCEARAADLYQELFLRLHRFRETYDPSRPFEPWFFHIARHVLVDEWRRRAREGQVALDESLADTSAPDARERAEARQEARRQLESLSPEQARILVDAKVWGFDYAEVAGALSKSVDAVKQAASRSLRRLRAAPKTSG